MGLSAESISAAEFHLADLRNNNDIELVWGEVYQHKDANSYNILKNFQMQ